MQRNNEDMLILSSIYASFESSATVEPRQRISNIYIYLYVSDQSVFIGSEFSEFPQKFKNTISWFFHDQQCNFHDYLMHGLQLPLLAASSPCWA